MNYNDHAPPHFHARYGSSNVMIDIRTLRVIDGSLPPRVLGLVVEWASAHTEELMTDWELARHKEPLNRISPLT